MEFKTAIEFVNFVSKIKNFKGINQMAQNMEEYLKFEKSYLKTFKESCINIANLYKKL